MPNLSEGDRLEHVLRLLEMRDSIGVPELSQLLGVSEVTARSDLRTLRAAHLPNVEQPAAFNRALLEHLG